MRPLRPRLQFTSSQWGSRPQPGQLPRIQCRLIRGSETRRREFPPREETGLTASEREWALEQCSLARQKRPLLSKIWWTMKHVPWLLKELVYLVVQYTQWRMLSSRLPEVEEFVVKSRIGRFLYDFLTYEYQSVTALSMTHQSDTHRIGLIRKLTFIDILSTTVKPWGLFSQGMGDSMQPTFINPAIKYSSNAYNDNQDIKLGDVVAFLGPERNYLGTGLLCKRVAALEGDRIWTIRQGRMQYIYAVRVFLFLFVSLY